MYYNNIDYIKMLYCNLLQEYNFIPLPSFFVLNYTEDINNKNIISENNNYMHCGKSHHDIIFANKSIPFYNLYNNIYYYELTISQDSHREEWNNMNISIGFGSKSITTDNMIIGWDKDSVGYSIDGNISCWAKKDINYEKYGKGDTVGAGVIYDFLYYKIFFTLNGKRCNEILCIPNTIELIPMIAINYNSIVSVNFNTKPFVYKIK